jgi:K+-sensing histidine kinase KdpD
VIALQSRGTEVGLAVIDDGEGLDPARARELIKRFRRGSKKEAGRVRLGLGLALVNEIVSAHGGTLTIDGAPGSGATFALLFPAGAQERRRAATGPVPERDRYASKSS